MHVEKIPPKWKVKYLQQMITFVPQETTEAQHMIRCAWSAVAKYRHELTSQPHLLRHRLHLFDAVVTPITTYGARTWTKTREHEKCSALPRGECFVSSRVRWKRHFKNYEMSEDAQPEDSTNDEYDQDSSISFKDVTESTSSQEDESECGIEFQEKLVKNADTTSPIQLKHRRN